MLRIFFHHLYTSLAWFYDAVAWITSVGQWSRWQRVGLDTLPQGRILELGFGTGHVLTHLTLRGQQAFGLDPSKQMVRLTQRQMLRKGLQPLLVLGKAQALPFAAESFDGLLSTFPSEFLFDRKTFTEAWRALKKGGAFVIIPGVAKITGPGDRPHSLLSLLDSLASVLYRATGEAIDPQIDWDGEVRGEFEPIGFSSKIELVELDRAVIVRITAVKDNHQMD
jgi:ubiquinone/menaquinone biosynthesis C-methylase UbiE